MGSAGLANGAASAGDEGSAGDACFCKFLLMMLAFGFGAGSAGVSIGDVCFILFLQVFANDAGFQGPWRWVGMRGPI